MFFLTNYLFNNCIIYVLTGINTIYTIKFPSWDINSIHLERKKFIRRRRQSFAHLGIIFIQNLNMYPKYPSKQFCLFSTFSPDPTEYLKVLFEKCTYLNFFWSLSNLIKKSIFINLCVLKQVCKNQVGSGSFCLDSVKKTIVIRPNSEPQPC